MAMRSIYIGQLVRPAAVPLTVRMRICLQGVAIVYYYPHPAIPIMTLANAFVFDPYNKQIIRYLTFNHFGNSSFVCKYYKST